VKPATKLWIRKRALMTLRAILWRADEWLHRRELALRQDLDLHKTLGSRETPARMAGPALPRKTPPAIVRESFLQWEARRSGVSPITKPHRRRGISAADFDRSFAR